MSGAGQRILKAIKSFFNKSTNTNMLQKPIKIQESVHKLSAVKFDSKYGNTKQELVKEINKSSTILEECGRDSRAINTDKKHVNDDTKFINEDKMNANEENKPDISEISTNKVKVEFCDIQKGETSEMKKDASHCISRAKVDIPIAEHVVDQVLPSQDNSQLKTFKTIKPHVPLIKFRKGGLVPQGIAANVGQVNEVSVDSLSTHTDPMGKQVYSLEWWQTPPKFKRRLIDELECDAINSGGGDRLWQ